MLRMAFWTFFSKVFRNAKQVKSEKNEISNYQNFELSTPLAFSFYVRKWRETHTPTDLGHVDTKLVLRGLLAHTAEGRTPKLHPEVGW